MRRLDSSRFHTSFSIAFARSFSAVASHGPRTTTGRKSNYGSAVRELKHTEISWHLACFRVHARIGFVIKIFRVAARWSGNTWFLPSSERQEKKNRKETVRACCVILVKPCLSSHTSRLHFVLPSRAAKLRHESHLMLILNRIAEPLNRNCYLSILGAKRSISGLMRHV